MKQYTINTKKILEKKQKLKLSDDDLSKLVDIDPDKLKKIINSAFTFSIDEYVNIMNFMNLSQRAIKIRLNEILEQEKVRAEEEKKRIAREKARERARKLHEEKKAKEFIEANRKESREATFRSRLKAVKESIQKSKSEVFLKNRIFVTKLMNKSDEREYSTGNFVRVPKGTDISELTDFYYRFSRSYNVNKESVHVEPETHLRHIDKTCIGRPNVEYYYNRGEVEIFLKVKEFPQIRKKEEVSTKEEE